jgi:ABC-type transporter Mla subunit MlaD
MVQATDRLPEILSGVLALIARVEVMLDRLNVEGLSAQGMETLKSTDRVMAALQKTLADLNAGKISQRADVLLDNLNGTVTQLNTLGARLNDEKGLVSSTQRTTNALGDLARNASGVSAELADTLRGVRDAADAIQRVADQLDRDPDMLLKGRAKAVKR